MADGSVIVWDLETLPDLSTATRMLGHDVASLLIEAASQAAGSAIDQGRDEDA